LQPASGQPSDPASVQDDEEPDSAPAAPKTPETEAAPDKSDGAGRQLSAAGQLALGESDLALTAMLLAQAQEEREKENSTTAASEDADPSDAAPPDAALPDAALPDTTPSDAAAQPETPSDDSATPDKSEPTTSSEETSGEGDAGEVSAATVPATAVALVGGTRVPLRFGQPIGYGPLREMIEAQLAKSDMKDVVFDVRNREYRFGSDRTFKDWTLEIAAEPEQLEPVLKGIQDQLAATPYFPSSNEIGGKVAGDTQVMALVALLASFVGIVIYVWIRFQNVAFGLAGLLALLHDVFITVSCLAISAYIADPLSFLLVDQFKISLPVVAALLTIVGFSINDTIVIFDRIREVRGKSPDLTEAMINLSINQTLSRTLLTSGTVLIASIILYIVGGQGIHAFAFAMVVGVVAGTYSTIYIAAPALLWMRRSAAAISPKAAQPAATVR
jgi:SecD/SecF fusion protein